MVKGKDGGKIYYDISGNEIYFNTDKEIPISDLIESLKALEKLASHSKGAFSELLGGKISRVEIYVESLEAGSLREKLLFRFIFEDEEECNKFLDKWRTKVRGMGKMKATGIAVAAVVGAMVLYGTYLAATRPGASTQTNIDFSNSNIFIIGAESFETSPEAFRMAIESSVGDKKALAKESLRFVEPARNAGGDIEFGGNSESSIEQSYISQLPEQAVDDPDETEDQYYDIDLEIRATDRDSRTQGWAGVIKGLAERRLPMEIMDDVDVNRLVKNTTVRADVTLLKRFDARRSGDMYRPYKIIVERLVEPASTEVTK